MNTNRTSYRNNNKKNTRVTRNYSSPKTSPNRSYYSKQNTLKSGYTRAQEEMLQLRNMATIVVTFQAITQALLLRITIMIQKFLLKLNISQELNMLEKRRYYN